MTTKPTIGFVGMGTMGGQMARRLAASGYRVTGYDVDADRSRRAQEGGVALAKSPAGAAEAADVVLSSLPDPPAVRRAYLGADGVLGKARRGTTLVDVSTIDPDTWRDVAAAAQAAGVDCLDAPVSGGPAEAGSGKLVFIVGGDAAVLERCRSLLLTLGTDIHHV
ncbi:MAG: NAD(P)-dependent oxidoreductase, partial [candidate division NC10 bacterium]